MLKILKSARQNGGIYFLLAGIGSAINLSYYPLMSRVLSRLDYANLGVINAFSLQLSAIFVALGIVVIDIYKNSPASEAHQKISYARAYVSRVFFITLFSSVFLWPILKDFLQLPSYFPLVMLCIYALSTIPAMFLGGHHQNQSAFFTMGLYAVSVAAGKVLSSFFLSLRWPGITSAVSGLLIGQIIGLCVLIFALKGVSFFDILFQKKNLKTNLDNRFLIIAIVSIFSLLLISNIDVLLIKYKFPEYSWQYIGPSLITNGFVFFSTTIAYIMVSKISQSKTHQNSWKILQNTTLVWGAVALPALLVFSTFATPLMDKLIGDVYITNKTTLYTIASLLFYCLVGLYYILTNFALANRINRLSLLPTATLLTCIISAVVIKTPVQQILLLIGILAISISYSFFSLLAKRRTKYEN